jgi:hypothetical protein
MFKNPNEEYLELYVKLISYRQINLLANIKMTEKHHILPKSLGGSNSKSNLVRLTFIEHLAAHFILAEMLRGEDRMKMEFALVYMLSLGSDCPITTLEAYELSRLMNKEANKKMWTIERRKKQSLKRLGTKDSAETIERKRQAGFLKPKPSPETIQKRAKSNTGQKRTEETCKNISNSKKNLSVESRLRISIAAKERQRKKALLPLKVMSDEERQRRSIASKKRELKKRQAKEQK